MTTAGSTSRGRAPRRAAALLAALVLAATSALAACDRGRAQAEYRPADPVGDPAAFPADFAADRGDVTIGAAPARVVAVTAQDADLAYALGVQPFGLPGQKRGDGFVAPRPWQTPLPGAERPRTVGADADTVNPRWVAELSPDVILATGTRLSPRLYDTLAGIAPTIVRPAADEPLDDAAQIALVGRALGLQDRADALVHDLDAARAPTGSRGALTVIDGTALAASEGATVLGADDPRTRVFADLGYVVSGRTRFIDGGELRRLGAGSVAIVGGAAENARPDPARVPGGGPRLTITDGDERSAFDAGDAAARRWLAGRLASAR